MVKLACCPQLASAVAWAASPHFISAMATLENDLSLTIKFKETGLVPSNRSITWH